MRVRIGGRIMSDDCASVYRRYGYQSVCCPADIRAALSQPEDEEGLIFELNSGGGSVYDGYEMYTVLKNSARKSTVEIQSIAASAASVFAMAADTVLISPVASIMIHRASTGTIGNEEDMTRSAQMLRTVDQGILNAYEAKCGGKISREELETLMKNETFMTAGEAVERGFADGILWEKEDPDARLTSSAVAMAGGMQAAMTSLPPLEDLRQAEKQTAKAGTKEEENTMPITLDELKQENGALLAQIRAEAAQQERERISAIEALSMAGFEDLIENAMNDPEATAESVAVKIVARQKEQGSQFLKDRQKDVTDSGMAGVKQEKSGGISPEDELSAILDDVFPETK